MIHMKINLNSLRLSRPSIALQYRIMPWSTIHFIYLKVIVWMVYLTIPNFHHYIFHSYISHTSLYVSLISVVLMYDWKSRVHIIESATKVKLCRCDDVLPWSIIFGFFFSSRLLVTDGTKIQHINSVFNDDMEGLNLNGSPLYCYGCHCHKIVPKFIVGFVLFVFLLILHAFKSVINVGHGTDRLLFTGSSREEVDTMQNYCRCVEDLIIADIKTYGVHVE